MTVNPIPTSCSVCDPKLHCACQQYLPNDYYIIKSGINSLGNHYDKFIYKRHTENKNIFHYRNRNGSCYLNAPDGSEIYNYPRGGTRRTFPVMPVNRPSPPSPSGVSSVPIKKEEDEDVKDNSDRDTISEGFVKVEIKEEE